MTQATEHSPQHLVVLEVRRRRQEARVDRFIGAIERDLRGVLGDRGIRQDEGEERGGEGTQVCCGVQGARRGARVDEAQRVRARRLWVRQLGAEHSVVVSVALLHGTREPATPSGRVQPSAPRGSAIALLNCLG